jgi:hypothetical protein
MGTQREIENYESQIFGQEAMQQVQDGPTQWTVGHRLQ